MNLDELAVQGQVVADRVLEGAEATGKEGQRLAVQSKRTLGCSGGIPGDAKLVKSRGKRGKGRGGGWWQGMRPHTVPTRAMSYSEGTVPPSPHHPPPQELTALYPSQVSGGCLGLVGVEKTHSWFSKN